MHHSLDNFNIEKHNKNKPYFKKENMAYFRKEKKGFITCYSKKAPFLNDMLINHMGIIILELCDGINTIADILGKMIDKYKDVTQSRIKDDLIKVLLSITV